MCYLDIEAENIMITPEKRVVIADFSYTCKTLDDVRRYGFKIYLRPPEVGNMNRYFPPQQMGNHSIVGLMEYYA